MGSEILEIQSRIAASSESLNVNVSELRGMKSESESIVSSSSLPLSTSMNGYGLGCGLSWVGVTLDAVDNVGEGESRIV